MSLIKNLNRLRKTVMHRLTRNIGRAPFKPVANGKQQASIKRILVCRPNHRLGNLLMLTPLLQEINNSFPDCKIDLFIKGGLGPVLFKNYNSIWHIISLPRKPFKEIFKYLAVWVKLKTHSYNIVINADKGSSSGRIATKAAASTYKFFGDEPEDGFAKPADYIHMAKQPVYNFRNNMSKLGYKNEGKPIPVLDIKLSEHELAKGEKILKELADDSKPSIAVFTYATGEKRYTASWWEEFYKLLKNEFSAYNIIEVLPVENISAFDFKIPYFYSKDVREIASFINHTTIFIGADSGIMHLASASGAATVGLFAITNPAVYIPYNANSTAVDTNKAGTNEIISMVKKILLADQNNQALQ